MMASVHDDTVLIGSAAVLRRHVNGYDVYDVNGQADAFTFEAASQTAFINFEPYMRRVITTNSGALENLLANITGLPGVLQCWLIACEAEEVVAQERVLLTWGEGQSWSQLLNSDPACVVQLL